MNRFAIASTLGAQLEELFMRARMHLLFMPLLATLVVVSALPRCADSSNFLSASAPADATRPHRIPSRWIEVWAHPRSGSTVLLDMLGSLVRVQHRLSGGGMPALHSLLLDEPLYAHEQHNLTAVEAFSRLSEHCDMDITDPVWLHMRAVYHPSWQLPEGGGRALQHACRDAHTVLTKTVRAHGDLDLLLSRRCMLANTRAAATSSSRAGRGVPALYVVVLLRHPIPWYLSVSSAMLGESGVQLQPYCEEMLHDLRTVRQWRELAAAAVRTSQQGQQRAPCGVNLHLLTYEHMAERMEETWLELAQWLFAGVDADAAARLNRTALRSEYARWQHEVQSAPPVYDYKSAAQAERTQAIQRREQELARKARKRHTRRRHAGPSAQRTEPGSHQRYTIKRTREQLNVNEWRTLYNEHFHPVSFKAARRIQDRVQLIYPPVCRELTEEFDFRQSGVGGE
jgi:hypothetical protein